MEAAVTAGWADFSTSGDIFPQLQTDVQALNTRLIKSYLGRLLLSLTDSEVIKLLKGVAGESVASRLERREVN